MSEVSFDEKATYFDVFMKMQEILKDVKQISTNNIKEIMEMMEIIVNKLGYGKLSILINLKELSMIPCEGIGLGAKYFLGICYIMNKEYHKAAKLLEDLNFMADSLIENQIEKIVVKASYYYASAMDKLGTHEKAMEYINMLFDEDIASYVDSSFRDRNSIIYNHYRIEQDDYVDNDDEYYLPFMKKMREKQKENCVDQMENRKIFE